jgi:hypothetical protein
MKTAGKRSFATWRGWFPFRRYRIVDTVPAADLIPMQIPRRGLVVVEGNEGPAWVAFDCPCRSRHRLMVRLSRTAHPHWTLDTRGQVSLRPSIDSTQEGVRCHFWLTNGRIRWADNR